VTRGVGDDDIGQWFSLLLADAGCQLEWMPVGQSAEWSVQDGVIAHRSKGFFTVVGLRWTSPAGRQVEQPFLDQQEIGTLGFVMRIEEGRRQLLVQAKFEPGNVGLIQLAPTCQATRSNIQRLHGGNSPPFVEYFPEESNALYDIQQSEQGTRFLRKRNRNVLVAASVESSIPVTHRWMEVDFVLDLMARDFLVNTDARSVLVCSPWQQLVSRAPFSRYSDGFSSELLLSMRSPSVHRSLAEVREQVQRLRSITEPPEIIGLDELSGWEWTPEGLSAEDGFLRVRHIRVAVTGREVPAWDQPIIDSVSDGMVLLVCARIDGVLHFLFRLGTEAGLYSRVELTATEVVEPGDPYDDVRMRWSGTVVAQCRQSEEGGRFYRDTNTYRIVDIGAAGETEPDCCWLTLHDIRQLLDEPGWLTNEARSVLSLLLPWL
jgi:oxidase EvaA